MANCRQETGKQLQELYQLLTEQLKCPMITVCSKTLSKFEQSGELVVGGEEDWWDIDELAELPPRSKAVLKAMEATAQMDEFQLFMQDMFDENDGEEEGGFAGAWTA